jgi:acetolactate synthase-1/2/3 large subunit
MEGKSAFPETHPLALGAGGPTMTRALATHVNESDVVFGVGVSFSPGFSIRWPTAGKTFVHNTVDERDLNKIIPARHPVLGDAKLTLAMLHEALRDRLRGKPRGLVRQVAARIENQNAPWLKEWMPYLTSNAKPLSPYRVVYDLLQTVDVANTIVTHDAGSPRDEMIPFWKSVTPLSYIGWGKTTQLGYGLGLAMGAKIAQPEKLCINYWGEAAIGMTGMDFETCVRCQIPIMSILSNNFGMKCEYAAMALSHKKYRTCDISGNYAEFAKAMGGYGERVTEPEQVVHAIVNGIRATREGKPVLLEFITTQEVRFASGGAMPDAAQPAAGD